MSSKIEFVKFQDNILNINLTIPSKFFIRTDLFHISNLIYEYVINNRELQKEFSSGSINSMDGAKESFYRCFQEYLDNGQAKIVNINHDFKHFTYTIKQLYCEDKEIQNRISNAINSWTTILYITYHQNK